MLLINGGELVAVEVKSRFKEGHKIYGAVAALKFNAGLERLAEKRGLFVFEPSGEVMSLANKKGFKPKAW